MGMTAGELEVVLSAKDQVSGVVRDVDANAGGLKGKLAAIGPVALTAFAAAAAGAVLLGKAVLDLGAQFDDAYDGIRIGTGETGKALEGLKNDFREVVKDVPTDFASASDAITELHRRVGATGKPLQDLTKQFLELSRLTGTDVAENIRLGTRLFGDWSVATADQASTMDLLFRASQQSGLAITDLMSTVVQFGAPLRNMGFDLAESAAMLGKWEEEGVNTSTVLTGMKFALKQFAAAGKEPKQALEEIIPAIRDMDNAQKAMALGMETFGLRAGPDMVAAIREGRFAYEDFQKAIEGGKDTIMGAAADTADWGEKFQILKNRALIGLEPVIMGVFNGLSKVFDVISAIASSPQVAALGSIAGAQFRLMGDVINAVLPYVRQLWDELVKGAEWVSQKMGPALADLGKSFGPALEAAKELIVTFAATVIKGIGEVVEFIRSHWDTIGPILKAAWDLGIQYTKTFFEVLAPILSAIAAILRGDWSDAWEHAKEAVRRMAEGVGSIMEKLATLIGKLAVAAMKALWEAFQGGVAKSVEFIASLPGKAVDALASLAGKLKTVGTQGMTGLWNGLKEIWGDVSGWVQALPGKIKGFFGGAASWLYNAGYSILSGLLNGIKNAWESVASYLGSLGGKIKDLKGPLDRDRQLLVPEGRAIMEGLRLGMEAGSRDVLALVAGLGPQLNIAVPGAGPGASAFAAAGGTTYQVSITIGTVQATSPQQAQTAGQGIGTGVIMKLAQMHRQNVRNR